MNATSASTGMLQVVPFVGQDGIQVIVSKRTLNISSPPRSSGLLFHENDDISRGGDVVDFTLYDDLDAVLTNDGVHRKRRRIRLKLIGQMLMGLSYILIVGGLARGAE